MGTEPKVEGVNPYGEGEKGAQVEEMFDSIAPAYDFMNNAMTLGLCRYWRNRALDMSDRALWHKSRPTLLDVATGTGDVAFELLRRYPCARVYGVDLSKGMLAEANRKRERLSKHDKGRICFRQGDSLDLPFVNDTFDYISVAYGVRNFAHLDKGISEMVRVLVPGGMLCIVELSEPENKLTRAMYRFYSRRLIPVLGSWVSGDKSAYKYLPQSIAVCPQREAMTELMRRAGLEKCGWKSLTFGAVTIYYGKKGF